MQQDTFAVFGMDKRYKTLERGLKVAGFCTKELPDHLRPGCYSRCHLKLPRTDPRCLLGHTQSALTVAQRLLCFLALSDVHGRANVSSKTAIGREAWHASIQYPTILTVMTPEAVLDLKVLAGVERNLISIYAFITVIRVDAIGPTVAQFLLQRSAREVQPWSVDITTTLVGTSGPDKNRSGVGHRAKALFTFL